MHFNHISAKKDVSTASEPTSNVRKGDAPGRILCRLLEMRKPANRDHRLFSGKSYGCTLHEKYQGIKRMKRALNIGPVSLDIHTILYKF